MTTIEKKSVPIITPMGGSFAEAAAKLHTPQVIKKKVTDVPFKEKLDEAEKLANETGQPHVVVFGHEALEFVVMSKERFDSLEEKGASAFFDVIEWLQPGIDPSAVDGRRVRVVKASGRQKKLIGQVATLQQCNRFTRRDFVIQLTFADGTITWMDTSEFEFVEEK